jgi:hypothetical protein
MSELDEIKSRLAQLEEEVVFLRAANGIPSGEAIVGAEYVALLIGCSDESVVRGRFGTDRLRRVREKPVGFVKREVDAWHKQNITPKAEKAAEARRTAKLIKRRTK